MHVLVTVSDHGATAIPALFTNDVHRGGQECVRIAHHGADVEVVLPILDRDVKPMAPSVEIGHDRLARPVAIGVNNVAAIAIAKQFGIVLRPFRPGLLMGTHPDRWPRRG